MEIWRDIAGYESLYQVSNKGRIKSLIAHNGTKERILKPHTIGHGYLNVDLCKNGHLKKNLVHRLVAQAFIENPGNLPQVNHKDENKLNNHADNLEWCTAKYNMNYGDAPQKRAEKRSKQVLQLNKDGQFVAQYCSLHDAERKTGIGISQICMVCKGKRILAGGYMWKYKEA